MPRRIRAALRRLVTAPERGAVVLAYHRIADVSLDPSGLAVSVQRFADQMAALVRIAEPVPLVRIAEGRLRGAGRRAAVAVTFDDGYADNLVEAKSVLDRLGIPATVFIPSNAIGRSSPFWWDELEAMVFGAGSLPQRLDLNVAGMRLAAVIHDDGGHIDATGRYRNWRVWNGPASTPRQRLYTLLWERLRLLPPADQEAALSLVSAWAGYDRQRVPLHPTLDAAGIRDLLAGGLIEAGGHTLSHAPLAHLPADLQRQEIEANRRDLQTLSGAAVGAFSYPYGIFSDRTMAHVRDAGYAAAVTTKAGPVTSRTDPYGMPRLAADDWDAREFITEVAPLLLRD